MLPTQLPIRWTAPEALEKRKFSQGTDTWAFGITMYEMWTAAALPYLGMNNQKVWIEVAGGFRLPRPPGCLHFVYAMMLECWDAEGSKRPSMDSLAGRLRRFHAEFTGEDMLGEMPVFGSQYSRTTYIPPSPKPIEGLSGESTVDSEYQYHHIVRDATLSRTHSADDEYDAADSHANAKKPAAVNNIYTDSRGGHIEPGIGYIAPGQSTKATPKDTSLSLTYEVPATAVGRESTLSSTSTYLDPRVQSGSISTYDDADLSQPTTYDDAEPIKPSNGGLSGPPGVRIGKPGQEGASDERRLHGGAVANPYARTEMPDKAQTAGVSSIDFNMGESPYVEPAKGIVSPKKTTALTSVDEGQEGGGNLYVEPGVGVSMAKKIQPARQSMEEGGPRMHGGVSTNVYSDAEKPASTESAYVEPGVGIVSPTKDVKMSGGADDAHGNLYVEPGVGISGTKGESGEGQQTGNVYASEASMGHGRGEGRVLVLDNNDDADATQKHRGKRPHHVSVSSTV